MSHETCATGGSRSVSEPRPDEMYYSKGDVRSTEGHVSRGACLASIRYHLRSEYDRETPGSQPQCTGGNLQEYLDTASY